MDAILSFYYASKEKISLRSKHNNRATIDLSKHIRDYNKDYQITSDGRGTKHIIKMYDMPTDANIHRIIAMRLSTKYGVKNLSLKYLNDPLHRHMLESEEDKKVFGTVVESLGVSKTTDLTGYNFKKKATAKTMFNNMLLGKMYIKNWDKIKEAYEEITRGKS